MIALAIAAVLAASPHSVTVQPGDTLSGIASANGVSLAAVEAANPQYAGNWNLIYSGQTVNLPGGGSVGYATPSQSSAPADHEPDGDSDDPAQPAPSYSPPAQAPVQQAPAASSGGGYSSSSLSDVPGVPSGFAACVAQRESSNGANQAYDGGVYGIINASGYHVNGQSLAAQKQAFSALYAQYGTAPWAPSDGC